MSKGSRSADRRSGCMYIAVFSGRQVAFDSIRDIIIHGWWVDLIIDIASNSNGCCWSIPGTDVECLMMSFGFINNSVDAGTTKYRKECVYTAAMMHAGTASFLLV